tara:strand:- start:1601 stop:2572 length:972 start_codon:yes stop_codon:yes gene_type:complete
MVRTGSNAFVHYGEEGTFNGGATQTRAFGLEQKVNSLTFKNNQIALAQLFNIEVASFAYGKNEGSGSIDFVLSNPWVFDTLLGGVDTSGSSSNYTHIWDSNYANLTADNTGIRQPKSFDVEVGFDTKTSTDVLRNLRGSVFTQLNIKSSIGETVKGTVDFLYGKIDTIGTSVSGVTPIGDGINFPYTFSHASIELLDGTTIAEVQDIDITLAANTELLYEQGDANAVGSFRKLFEMTGKFNASFIDKVQLQRVFDRTEVATLTVEFTNGLTGTSEKSIKLEFAGISLSEHSLSIAPNEPIFQDLSFQMRNLKVTANNSIAVVP